MNLIYFIRSFILSNYFNAIVYCMWEADDTSLIVTKNNNEFKLTIPYKCEFKEDEGIISYFKIPKEGKTYNFCPDTMKSVENTLYKKETLTPNSEVSDAQQCLSEVLPVFGKVKNPEKIKNMGTNEDEIQLYHSGFLLFTKDLHSNKIKRKKEEDNPTERKVQYLNNWDSDNELFVQVEVFYNPRLKRTAAVQYKLLSTTLPFYEKFFIVESYILSFKVEKCPKLFILYNTNDYMAEFNKKIHADWIKKIGNDFSGQSIKLSQFASIYHFQLPTWERAGQFMLNIVPLWTKTRNKWHIVEKFAPVVANNLGDLEVSAGVTGIMTLSDEDVVDPRGFKMPKYFWKAFEYRYKNEVYGILVIMHCNPFEKTEKKICEQVVNCDQIGWPISNDDFHTGEIYCCEMNEENIENLKADYLSLKKREIFNLNIWMEKKVNILSDFIDVLNEFIKYIVD